MCVVSLDLVRGFAIHIHKILERNSANSEGNLYLQSVPITPWDHTKGITIADD
jgi:hypothetical protein